MSLFVYKEALEHYNSLIYSETTPEARQAAIEAYAELNNEIEQISRKGGQWNRALAEVYKKSTINFKAIKKAAAWKERFKEDLPADLMQKFQEQDKRIEELVKERDAALQRIAEQEANEVISAIQEDIAAEEKKQKPASAERKAKIAKKRESIKDRIKKKSFGRANSLPVDLLPDYLELAATYIEEGVINLKDFAAKLRADHKELFGNSIPLTDEDIENIHKQATEPPKAELTESGRVPRKLVREIIKNGAKDINEVVAELQKVYPDLSPREIRDAVTGYGQTIQPNPDEVERQIREMTEIGRHLSAMEDVAKGELPKRSGLQREKRTPEKEAEKRERDRALKEMVNTLPVDTKALADRQKTQLDAAKTRIKNYIQDLDRAIEKGERLAKKNTNPATDAELEVLRRERDLAKKRYDEAFEKDGLTDEQRLININKALERDNAELQRMIDEGDLFPDKSKPEITETPELKPLLDKRKDLQEQKEKLREEVTKQRNLARPDAEAQKKAEAALKATNRALNDINERIRTKDLEFKKKQAKISTPALDAAREQLKKQKDVLADMQKEEGITELHTIERLKEARKKRIAELQEHLAKGTAKGKRKKHVYVETELTKIDAELMAIREEYDAMVEAREKEDWTAFDKFLNGVGQVWEIPRASMATGDASFVGVQGLLLSVAHPKIAIKALRRSWQHFKSEEAADNYHRSLHSQEWFPIAKAAGLSLTGAKGKITKSEELFFSKWFSRPYKKIIDLLVKDAQKNDKLKHKDPVKAFERAAVGYLDTLRMEVFLLEANRMTAAGMDINSNLKDFKDVARAINTFTGRAGLNLTVNGKVWVRGESIAAPLSKIFFSPRNAVSTAIIGSPAAIVYFGTMTPTARRMAMRTYLRWAGSTAAIVGLAALYFNNDDDDETEVPLDPRRSDFAKIRLGNIVLDPWTGKMQWMVLTARLATQKTYYRGKLTNLGEGQAPTSFDLVARTASNKVNPMMGTALEVSDMKKDKRGNYSVPYEGKMTPSEYGWFKLKEMATPMYYNSAAELIEEDKRFIWPLILPLNFFGIPGVGIYDAPDKKKKKKRKDD